VSTSYGYDKWGRVIDEIKNIKGQIYATHFTFNYSSQPLTITYPDDFLVRYDYNSVGQTNQVYYQPAGGAEEQIVESVSYSPISQISQVDYANGTISQMTYDVNQAYRLTSKLTTAPLETLQNISYTYDNAGNITQITDDVTHQLAKTSIFSYDDLYRLTNAQITDDYQSITANYSFDYDSIGNILNKSDLGSYQYAYNNPYQASAIAGNAQQYDDNGNLTLDTERTMVYDYQDRLSSVTIGGNTTNYYYDHSKTRVAKPSTTFI